MRIVIFCHSIRSDWNHGNAHFLRGVVTELQSRGHAVEVYEPRNSWSAANLAADHGPDALDGYRTAYPTLAPVLYDTEALDLDAALDDADLVIVHEWNSAELIASIGRHRRHSRYRLLFHDTHHRAVSDPGSVGASALADYDGVLAYGASLREQYVTSGWSRRVWVWHEAADTRVFHPAAVDAEREPLVWIGNWGDGERTTELWEYLLAPVQTLRLRAAVHGVRYPEAALAALKAAGCDYRGWLPNYRVPEVFARFQLTVHVPRRAYVDRLPGIPTIRPFEAMACGIPLVSSPWLDSEGLFRVGQDFLMARSGKEMTSCMRAVLHDADLASQLSKSGLETILARHTCGHRVDELLAISGSIGARVEPCEPAAAH